MYIVKPQLDITAYSSSKQDHDRVAKFLGVPSHSKVTVKASIYDGGEFVVTITND